MGKILLVLLAAAFIQYGVSSTDATVTFCPNGWTLFRTHCYLVTKLELSWSDAKSACAKSGASLVRPRTNEEQNFIDKTLVGDWHLPFYWTDLSDVAHNGTWRFSDGSAPTHLQWATGSPSGNYDCAY